MMTMLLRETVLSLSWRHADLAVRSCAALTATSRCCSSHAAAWDCRSCASSLRMRSNSLLLLSPLGARLSFELPAAFASPPLVDDLFGATPRASGEYRIDIGNKSAAKSRTVILSN